MNITPININQNRPSFTSIPINNLKLIHNMEGKGVNATFSKLDTKDLEDITALKQILNTWNDKHNIVHQICKNFLIKNNSYDYYVMEAEKKSKNSLGDRILGLMQIYKSEKQKELKLKYLFVNGNFSNTNASRKFKGTGTALLGECFDIAKKEKFENFTFLSVNDDFYTRLFEKTNTRFKKEFLETDDNSKISTFSILNLEFNKIVKYCENKYNIDFSKKKSL